MFTKKYFVYAAVAIACGAGGAWLNDQQEQQALAQAGAAKAAAASAAALPAPVAALFQQQLKDAKGAQQSLAQWRGQGLLVNFWATWCAPCVREMPLIDRFHREYAPRGWQVLGLAVDRPAPVAEYLKRVKVGFPIGLAGLDGMDLLHALGNFFDLLSNRNAEQ